MLIKKDPDTIKAYLEDSSNIKGGYAQEVVIPSTIEELSAFVKEANREGKPLTISGGGTGTTGSRIPFGGAVISMEKFNRILGISEKGLFCALQTGVLVDDLKRAAEEKGLFYTSHPTERTASVGGTVATNASGSRSFKYGSTRGYVNRLKMVLANGEVFEVVRGQRMLKRDDSRVELAGGGKIIVPLPTYKIPKIKNSAGYFAKDGMDLIDLFIGQEGTLSIIVDMDLGLARAPRGILSSFVFFRKEEDAWAFSDEARRTSKAKRLDDSPGLDAMSIEYFDSDALRILAFKDPNVPRDAHAAIFFEQETSPETEDVLTHGWLDIISRHNASLDNTWAAMNEKEQGRFTELRHYIPEWINDSLRKKGGQKFATDIAVPEDSFSEMMNFYKDTLKGSRIEHVIFGHIGECHVHVNLLPKSEDERAKAKEMVMRFIKKGVSLGGTVSAEHGIGKTKHEYLEIMYGASGVMEMARIKKAFDHGCILGLDNIFPKALLHSV